MHRSLPPTAWILGLLGLLPFLLCAGAALSRAEPEASAWLLPLVGYGAVILAFLGGVHWGFVLGPAAEPARPSYRLALGVLPSLIGWAALLAPLLLPVEAALALLAAGFVATLLTERRLARDGLVPAAYMRLRWVLSIVVLLALLITIALRALGAKLII